MICRFGVQIHTWGRFGGNDLGAPDVVDAPGEGPQVKYAEEGHFDAEEERRDADLDVGGLDAKGGLDGAGGGKERNEELWENIC